MSDQDADSMLSFREFCIALYLMERSREGCPLPNVLPDSVKMDPMLPLAGHPSPAYGATNWGRNPGMHGNMIILVILSLSTCSTSICLVI